MGEREKKKSKRKRQLVKNSYLCLNWQKACRKIIWCKIKMKCLQSKFYGVLLPERAREREEKPTKKYIEKIKGLDPFFACVQLWYFSNRVCCLTGKNRKGKTDFKWLVLDALNSMWWNTYITWQFGARFCLIRLKPQENQTWVVICTWYLSTEHNKLDTGICFWLWKCA